MLQPPSKGGKGEKSKGRKGAPVVPRKNIRFVHKRLTESSSNSVGIILPHHQPTSDPSSTPTSSIPPVIPPSPTTPSIPPSISSFTNVSSTPSSTPSTPALSTTVPDEQNVDIEQQGYLLGSIGPDGRLCIGLHNKGFFPSSRCATIIHSTFEERVDPDGYKWVNLSDATVDFYWDEFQKKCYWDDAISHVVKAIWKSKARYRYRQYIHNMSSRIKNKSRKKPTQLSPEVWTAWNAVWDSEEFKEISKQNKINRRKGVENGPALPTHTSGSASHSTVAAKLEKQLGHPPSCFELFVHTHTKSHDGTTFLVERAKDIHDTFEQRREELNVIGEVFDEDDLFYEVVGGHDRKRRLYGLGSYGNLITSSKGSFDMHTSPSVGKEHLETKTKLQNLENLVAEQKEQYEGIQEKLSDFENVKKQLAEALVVIKNLGDTVKVLTNK